MASETSSRDTLEAMQELSWMRKCAIKGDAMRYITDRDEFRMIQKLGSYKDYRLAPLLGL